MATTPRYSIGIFDEGTVLQVVCLLKKGNDIKVVDAEVYKLAGRLESVDVGEDSILHQASVLTDISEPVELNNAAQANGSIQIDNYPDNMADQNLFILREILSKYSHKKYNIAISLSEPQVYYTTFTEDWGLDGEELADKVIEELSVSHPNRQRLKDDDFELLRMSDGRLLTIIRDSTLKVINLLESVQKGIAKKISFLESAEISLVKLVIEIYLCIRVQISLIVYALRDYIRLIFMRGNLIYSISNLIEAGLDTGNIANTIYSRILLEQDNLQLPKINNVILSGESHEANLADFLRRNLSGNIHIEYINFQKFGVPGMESVLSRFSVAIGSALRALETENEFFYDVDLTPEKLLKSNKGGRFGLLGWVAMIFIAIMTCFATISAHKQFTELGEIGKKNEFQQAELDELNRVEERLNAEKTKLTNYDKALVIIDSLMIGSNTWSDFLSDLTQTTQKIGGIWVSEVSFEPQTSKVKLKGYSTGRERIPQFSKAFNDATLKVVEVKERQGKRLYFFHVETIISK